MNRRNMTIALIAVVAIGLGLVVYGVMMQPHKAEPVMRGVLTAAMRIPAKAHVTGTMLTTVQRQADQVQADALANPGDAIGQIAVIDIPEGGVVTSSALAKPTPPPTGLQVQKGMRAVTIPIDPVKGLAGLIKVGDHVDVMAIPPRGPGTPEAFTFLRDIRVLAIGSDTANPTAAAAATGTAQPTPAPALPSTVTLAVTPAQADLLASADINSTLRLALRSPGEPANSQPIQPLEYPQTMAKIAPSPTPPSNHPGVTVINGDTIEQ
jgi:pilus assembly protein CpaB